MKRLTLVLALVAAAGGTASAQSRKAADRVHDFHTLDRQTPMTTFGLSFGFESWDHPTGEPVDQIFTIDLGGQFVSESGAGAYLTLPMTYVTTREIFGIKFADDELALGNLELGGLYAGRLGKTADLVVHGGVALPTADHDSGIDAGRIYGPAGAFVHLEDLVDRWPNTTWLRAGISPMGRISMLFWRFDVGVDIRLDDQDDKVDISPVVHVGAGLGVDFGQAEVTGELANVIDNPDDDNADDTLSTFAIGARFKSQNVQPGFSFILPIGADDAGVDDFNFALAASITGRMP